MKKKIIDRTTGRYIIVGIVNTLFGSAVMYAAYNIFGCTYWVSSALNYIFGSILSFFLNKYFTFRSQGKTRKEIVRFVVNILTCYFVAYGVARPLLSRVLGSVSVPVLENAAMALGILIFVTMNYFGQKFFVFRD